MRKFLALGLLMALFIGTASAALFESGTKDAQPMVLYGKYNNTIVPVKVAADGTVGAGGGGTPGGTDTQVQFNNADAFGGDAGLLYNSTTDVLTISGSVSTPTITGAGAYSLELPDSNITWVGIGDSLATAITNATAGDTLILAAGTYSFTSITIDKALRIIGQGIGKTVLASSATTAVAITVNASNVSISDLSITQSSTSTNAAALFLTGTAGTVLSGVTIRNIDLTYTMNASAGSYNSGFQAADSSFSMYNSKITATNSNTGNIVAGIFNNQATAEAATTINIYDSVFTATSAAGSGTPVVAGIQVADLTASQDVTVNVYNSVITAIDGVAGATTYALYANVGANAKINSYGNVLAGDDSGYASANSAVVTAYNDTLITDAASGAVFSGTLRSGNISLSGTLVSAATNDIGWSVVAGANTACNTTCTSACVVGFASAATGSDPVACTDATADICLCAGSS